MSYTDNTTTEKFVTIQWSMRDKLIRDFATHTYNNFSRLILLIKMRKDYVIIYLADRLTTKLINKEKKETALFALEHFMFVEFTLTLYKLKISNCWNLTIESFTRHHFLQWKKIRKKNRITNTNNINGKSFDNKVITCIAGYGNSGAQKIHRDESERDRFAGTRHLHLIVASTN